MTIKKLDLGGMDLLGADLDKFAGLFPDLVTEEMDETGRLKKSIDFEKFKARFSADIISEGKERYEFTWPCKRAAMAEANTPINKTLRPVVEESKNWDSTENLYIEGDNLEVLKLLQESYLGKVKMVYIDPPYNTGNDFVYDDDFKVDMDEYKKISADYDEEENKLRSNTKSNERFHSDWCSMIYPRLRLARNLLSDDGVIFISISDIEQANLRKICDEIFGPANFIAALKWTNNEGGGSSDTKLFRVKDEYIYLYGKDVTNVKVKGLPPSNIDRYTESDYYESTRGKFYLQKLGMGSIQYSESLDYPITLDDGTILKPSDNNSGRRAIWRWSKNKYEWGLKNDYIVCKKDKKGIWTLYTKQYLNADNEGNIIQRTQAPLGIITKYSSTQGSKELVNLDMDNIFSYPKPSKLIKYLIERNYEKDALIMDFFSGSATTAHAVMDLNAEDGGKRKFIMVQLPEETDENSEAYKAGYKNICEIGKERIRRAGEKILADNKDKEGIEKLDTGFRVLRIDSTNMNDVAIEPNLLEQNFLDEYESNIKADRTDLDLLFACLLAWGLPLDRKHESEDYHGFTIHSYNDGDLIACFDENISEEAIKYMAKKEPLRVVFRDSCFESSQDKINVEEIFKIFSPETDIRVL